MRVELIARAFARLHNRKNDRSNGPSMSNNVLVVVSAISENSIDLERMSLDAQ